MPCGPIRGIIMHPNSLSVKQWSQPVDEHRSEGRHFRFLPVHPGPLQVQNRIWMQGEGQGENSLTGVVVRGMLRLATGQAMISFPEPSAEQGVAAASQPCCRT
jgi:hypothetical protein